jgi:hypothetical protein
MRPSSALKVMFFITFTSYSFSNRMKFFQMSGTPRLPGENLIYPVTNAVETARMISPTRNSREMP